MANPLSAYNVRDTILELEQTAVAVSAMGTSRRKLGEMAAKVERIVDALVGLRPDVHRVRVELHRAVHNAKVSSTRAGQASERLRQMVAGLRRVQGLLNRRMGDVEATFKAGGFDVVNVWGYSKPESVRALNALGDADRKLRQMGLPKLSGGFAYLDPAGTLGFAVYRREDDSLVMDPSRPGDSKEVFAALGDRLWRKNFRKDDRETWGDDERGSRRFQDAFASVLGGGQLSADERARLQLTVGVGV